MMQVTTLDVQQPSKSGRRPRRKAKEEELGKKPKKVNSETRKQQNRIASRNYREKRKRKLHYLQQLVRDGSNDEKNEEASSQEHDTYFRSPSVDYDIGPSSSPFPLSSNGDYTPLGSSGITTQPLSCAPAPNISTYDSHLLSHTQPYPLFESSWSSHVYDPPLLPSVAHTPAWTSSMDYTSRLDPHQEPFHATPPAAQAPFEPTASPYHNSEEFQHQLNPYDLNSPYGHYHASRSQAVGLPNVSLPTSSSYFQVHYPGPH